MPVMQWSLGRQLKFGAPRGFIGLGKYGYNGGASGTLIVPLGYRVIGVSAHAPTAGPAGSLAINAGDSIPIPAGMSANGVALAGIDVGLIAPTIVFTGTDSYWVEYLIL